MEYAAPRSEPVAIALNGFLQRVFLWMLAGLALTGGIAAVVGSSDSLLNDVTDNPILLIGLFVVSIGIVIALSAAIEKISTPVAITLFFVYAAINGVLFSFIFEVYAGETIFTTFLVTSAMFGALAAFGYFTGTDLTKLGPILFMALIGLILASIVNVFVGAEILYWITTYAGVIIFSGLTAYDMQKLKRIGEGGASGDRQAIRGALALYLDFINLFLFLLRIFGRR